MLQPYTNDFAFAMATFQVNSNEFLWIQSYLNFKPILSKLKLYTFIAAKQKFSNSPVRLKMWLVTLINHWTQQMFIINEKT